MVLTRQGEWHQVMTVTAPDWQCTVCAVYTHKIKSQGCITAYCSKVKCKTSIFKIKHELYSLTLSNSRGYCRDESFFYSSFISVCFFIVFQIRFMEKVFVCGKIR